MLIKFLTAFILTVLLAYAAYLFNDSLPWWSFAIGVFIVGIAVPQKAWLSWLTGFTGLFVCWGILAFSASSSNQHLLAGKMASILPLGGSAMLIIILTAFIGALIGGFAALTGTFLRKQ
jgi:hypothetical protein